MEIVTSHSLFTPSNQCCTVVQSFEMLEHSADMSKMVDYRSEDGFDSGKPHFFKVIVEDTIKINKIELPKKFVKKHGGGLSSPVSLKVPGGMMWQIDIIMSKDESMWLCNESWQKFVQHYSLKHGHFVVFQYDGGSHFSVAIFDFHLSTEILYPSSSSSSENELVSKYPFFKIVVRSTHLTKPNMSVPKSFSERFMEGRKQEIELQVGEMLWKVNGIRNKKSKQVQMAGGVGCFVRDNSLRVGDICYFELIATSKDGVLTFRVTIVKA
ncbi:B3 domain-containing transcription factor VRN1 [Linum perenne]